MADQVQLRPVQHRLVTRLLARSAAGEPTTVAVMSPGAGKSLGAIACHIAGRRAGLWDRIVWLSPRLNLAGQAESDWRRWSALFDRPPPPVVHRANGTVLHPTGTSGYITTYQSLTASPQAHLSAMVRTSGRTLLVLDEAQWLGIEDDGGTAAGQVTAELADLAAHTLVMTGTPYRSDGQTIVGAEPYYRQTPSGRRRLEAHVTYTYGDGVADRVLRPFQADLLNADVDITDDDGIHHRRLSGLAPGELSAAVRSPLVYGPILDRTVDRLDRTRRLSPHLGGIVLAVDRTHARAIADYLDHRFPDLRVAVALSDDDRGARTALDGMKRGRYDLLIAVGMVHVGYDCPTLAVVGLLTNVRHHGWLEQAVGRGLRMWSGAPPDRQVCFVVGPADPALARWAEVMRSASDTGSAARPPVEDQLPQPARGPQVRTDRTVESATFDGSGVVYGHDPTGVGDMTVAEADQLSLLAGDAPSETAAAARLRATGVHLADLVDHSADMTVAEARAEANREVRRIVSTWAIRNGAGRGKVAQLIADAHRRLNRAQRVDSSADLVTLEQVAERVELARRRWT